MALVLNEAKPLKRPVALTQYKSRIKGNTGLENGERFFSGVCDARVHKVLTDHHVQAEE